MRMSKFEFRGKIYRAPSLRCIFRGEKHNTYRLQPGVKRFHHKQIPWIAKHVIVGSRVLEYPDFVKSHGINTNESKLPQDHSFWYPQGLLRHIISKRFCFRFHLLFELRMVLFRNGYRRSKRHLPMKRAMYHIVGFFLGLNCGFGMKACIQYTYWMLKCDGRPIAVKTLREFFEMRESDTLCIRR